jgi:hypothetical protein
MRNNSSHQKKIRLASNEKIHQAVGAQLYSMSTLEGIEAYKSSS